MRAPGVFRFWRWVGLGLEGTETLKLGPGPQKRRYIFT
jgi:hypothetical protein